MTCSTHNQAVAAVGPSAGAANAGAGAYAGAGAAAAANTQSLMPYLRNASDASALSAHVWASTAGYGLTLLELYCVTRSPIDMRPVVRFSSTTLTICISAYASSRGSQPTANTT
eukprot:jgi/Chrzof1/12166/Cz06g23160.t1